MIAGSTTHCAAGLLPCIVRHLTCCLKAAACLHVRCCRHACRDKEHSTIIYEAPQGTPLMRLGWNKQDPRYMATVLMDSMKVVVLDIR